jgi:agmatine/peptidylarginine deiminase
MFSHKRLIAEFEEQSFTQIIFPHAKSDWAPYLREAQDTFVEIVNAIIPFQKCLVIADNLNEVKKNFKESENLCFVEYESDDTWARDCSALCVSEDKRLELLNFTFNGWGNKFDASKDNALTPTLKNIYNTALKDIDFVLEGGAVESNGYDTILTTTACMFNPNRNPDYSTLQITQKLKEYFGAEHILYLNHGYLAGDDTDSHIDTLARFIDEKSIMYISCDDKDDEHYHQLKLMREELEMIAQEKNLKLIALPFCDALYYDGERLPATYANFLFVNGAVLVPIYGVSQDKEAIAIFEKSFPDKKICPIDCSVLVRQHGSLHCVTMNFAAGISLSC